jgi:hypothetical protein
MSMNNEFVFLRHGDGRESKTTARPELDIVR